MSEYVTTKVVLTARVGTHTENDPLIAIVGKHQKWLECSKLSKRSQIDTGEPLYRTRTREVVKDRSFSNEYRRMDESL